jgi:hypothetical protein
MSDRQFNKRGAEIQGRHDIPEGGVHCWIVVQVDEADSTYLGYEGPFWTETALDEFLHKCPQYSGVLDVIAVPASGAFS